MTSLRQSRAEMELLDWAFTCNGHSLPGAGAQEVVGSSYRAEFAIGDRGPDVITALDKTVFPANENTRTHARWNLAFVIEIVSKSSLRNACYQKFATVWIPNGLQMGWLVDVENNVVDVWQAGAWATLVPFNGTILATPVFPGQQFDFGALENNLDL